MTGFDIKKIEEKGFFYFDAIKSKNKDLFFEELSITDLDSVSAMISKVSRVIVHNFISVPHISIELEVLNGANVVGRYNLILDEELQYLDEFLTW